MTLRARLAAVPAVTLEETAATQQRIDDAVAYLASSEAVASVQAESYWPKWRGPWWQMLTLYELGLADRIPKRIVRAMAASLDALPMHTFPLRPEDCPPELEPRHVSCHCALGCMDQLLDACGVDVDRELPWIRAWYTNHQMADGGYNCDERAYLVEGDAPSSMVGTVPVLESLLRRGPSDTADRAAAMLIARELRHGSHTEHNAAERESAKQWGELAFPRFYLYDVLRGAAVLVRWAVAHGRALPLAAVTPVLEHLLAHASDGVVRTGRLSWVGCNTFVADDNWKGRRPAEPPHISHEPGTASAALTRQWAALRSDVIALIDAGRAV